MSVAGLGVYGMPEAMTGNVARPNSISWVREDVMHLESNECSNGMKRVAG